MTSISATKGTKNLLEGKNDTKTYILNILRLLDLNKVNFIKILNFIAEGGFGSVSTCSYQGTEFLLKTLKTIETKAYMDEFKLTYKYRNPGIPKVIAAYEPENFQTQQDEKGNEIGVMFEFVNGQTLNNLLYKREKGKKKKADVNIHFISRLYYMIQLSSIMEFLHDHSLVHRDLKPDNLIIDCYNNLKVIDFGISIQNNTVIDLTSSNNSYTLKYVPVDLKFTEMNGAEDLGRQLKPDENVPIFYKITSAFDVWCLGIIIGEVLLGWEPWGGKSEDRIIGMVCDIDEAEKSEFEYPLPKPEKIMIEKEFTKNLIINLVKDCTKFEPEKRIKMTEVKKRLWEAFIFEVKSDYHNLVTLQNKDAAKFKDNASQVIEHLKLKKKITTSVSLDKFESPLITIFKNSIRYVKTQAILLSEKITEIESNAFELQENSNASSLQGRKFVYMTYNEFDDSILALVFPENKQVVKHNIISNLYEKKNYKLKNPYCLNYKNKLYLTGGMIIDTKYKASTQNITNNIKRLTNTVNLVSQFTHKEYLEVFGNNYFKTKKAICFNFFEDKVITLPDMATPRSLCSSIIYKGNLVVAGDSELIERLNVTMMEVTGSNSGTEQWQFLNRLSFKVYHPLLLNFNNHTLYIINQKQGSIIVNYFSGFSNDVKTTLIDLGNLISHDFTFRGCYSNIGNEERIYIFASGRKENELHHYSIEVGPISLRKIELEMKGCEEIFTENPFSIEIEKTLRKYSKQNLIENNPNQIKALYEKVFKFDNSFFIHNSFNFYHYDNHLYYYTMNILKTGLTVRQFDLNTIQ